MKIKFDVIFLDDAIEFIGKLDTKTRNKIFYNIDKSKVNNDPKLFKKLNYHRLKGEGFGFRLKPTKVCDYTVVKSSSPLSLLS